MNTLATKAIGWGRGIVGGWDRFWFRPARPHTLSLIRIFAGLMLLYTHLVWTIDLEAFFGAKSWIPTSVSQEMHGLYGNYVWTYLWHVESPALLYTLHAVGLVVIAMSTLGLLTRFTAAGAWFFAVMYCHRLLGALFGLDQINVMLAAYVAIAHLFIAPRDTIWSLDRLIAKRRAKEPLGDPRPTVAANVAVRLIQIHLCVIYLFGGLGKMKGGMWWDGSAMWYSVANFEYQSLDMTWLAYFPLLIAALSHLTVFWETFYVALIWPRATRPVCLAIAVLVHGGIALFLGMITFGLAMLIANLAFVPPETVRGLFSSISRLAHRAQVGTAPANDDRRDEPASSLAPGRRSRRGRVPHRTA